MSHLTCTDQNVEHKKMYDDINGQYLGDFPGLKLARLDSSGLVAKQDAGVRRSP